MTDLTPIAHDHGTDQRCRLCTANDLDAIVEEIAAAAWETRRDPVMGDPAWEDAGHYWQDMFRGYARSTVAVLRR